MSDSSTENLGGHARRGAKLMTLGQIARVAANFVGTVVLARLLAPDDFGLMALVLSVAALAELLRDFGLTTAAARSTTINQFQKTNLFWVNTSLGASLTVLVVVFAGPIASLFGEPALQQMLVWTAPMFLFNGASAQFRAEINRKLQFGRLALVESGGPVIGFGVAIAWAAVSPTEMALVAQQLSTHGLSLIAAIALASWWPGMPNRRGSIKEFANYGGGLFGTQLIAYGARNGDNLMLGAVWGTGPLGIYSRAFQLLMLPINQLLAPLSRVAVPVLSRVAKDLKRLNGYLNSVIRMNLLILGAGLAFAFGLASPLVDLVFGDQWVEMVPIFQALCIGGIFKALNQANFWAFLATANTGAQFRFSLWAQPLIVICMAVGLPWGAFGVAVGHSVGYGLYWLLASVRCAKVCGTELGAQLREVAFGFGSIVFPVAAFSWVSSLILNQWIAVAVGVAASGAWLALLVWRSTSVRSTVMTLTKRGG